jgi:HEPN domain-containing protein
MIAFHCHQAIEKYLKAYLIEHNVTLIKTHDLIKLNGMIKEIHDLKINKDKLILINEVYIESRYPGELGLLPNGMPTEEEAAELLVFANEIKLLILKELED